MTYNSRLAQELAKWAETQDGGTAIHDALYRAYFVDGLNIAQIDNLMAVVRKLGLPEDEAREVLASRRFRARSRCGLAALSELGHHCRAHLRCRQPRRCGGSALRGAGVPGGERRGCETVK